MLPWPPQSPDINPIESCWGLMSYRMRKMTFTNAEDCWAQIQKEWARLPQTYLASLADGMPERLQQLRASRGRALKY